MVGWNKGDARFAAVLGAAVLIAALSLATAPRAAEYDNAPMAIPDDKIMIVVSGFMGCPACDSWDRYEFSDFKKTALYRKVIIRKIDKYKAIPKDLAFMEELIQIPNSPRFFVVRNREVVTWEEGGYAWKHTIVPLLEKMLAEN